MIITKKKDIETILESLEGSKRVYLFGCNACAEQSQTGGEAELRELDSLLKDKGFDVVGTSRPATTSS
jgi:hypothetical protein